MRQEIRINNQYYTYGYIQSGRWRSSRLSAEVQEVFEFLEEWLSDEPTVVTYSSGTTGSPKKMRLKKSVMRHSAQATGKYFHFEAGQKTLLALSPKYIAGKMMLVRAVEWQLELLVAPRSSSPLKDLREDVDFVSLVPAQLGNTLRHPEVLKHVKVILLGGAPLSATLEQRLQSITTSCFIGFGMTETMGHIALRRVNGEDRQKQFSCLPGVRVSVDKRECLLIEAPEYFAEPLITNDVVTCFDDQHFEWLGRYDHIINSGGVKINPERVESSIAPWLKCRYYISSQPDEQWGNILVLVIESEPWQPVVQENLLKQLKAVLPPYHCPKKINFLSSFPETSSGKIIRMK